MAASVWIAFCGVSLVWLSDRQAVAGAGHTSAGCDLAIHSRIGQPRPRRASRHRQHRPSQRTELAILYSSQRRSRHHEGSAESAI